MSNVMSTEEVPKRASRPATLVFFLLGIILGFKRLHKLTDSP